MRKNKAKFFCENCGTEVPENAKVCKQCGKFFSAVRCPNCGATGNASEFAKGCPLCGYGVNGSRSSQKDQHSSLALKENFSFNTNGTDNRWTYHAPHFIKRDHSLPPWIYIITSCMLITLIIVFYSCLKSPTY